MIQAIRQIRGFVSGLPPLKLLLVGYSSYVLVGWGLLCLPVSHRGAGVSALDHLFVSTSAVSTTGLVPVSIAASYTWLGQAIVLLLIQMGGLGYMTFSSFVLLSHRRPLSDARAEVSKGVFSLPRGFRVDKFIRSVVVFTALIETAGAAALYAALRASGVEQPGWSAVFHSVSSFCTAGFSLYDTSMEAFRGDFWVNAIVCALSYCGAIGFIVFVDVWRRVTGKVGRVTLTSKIILWTTFWVSAAGTGVLFVSEPTIRTLPPAEGLLAAFFQAMTAMTTVGFNTLPVAGLSRASVLLLTVLMVIGASPSGTGGGLKSTTFTAILGLMRSTLRGRSEVTFWGRPVPPERVWTAVASFSFYVTFLVIGLYLLTLTENSSLQEDLFEAASALGTVGLSLGITPSLSALGKLVVTALMFIGRVGPLTFGTAVFLKQTTLAPDLDHDVAI